MGRTWTLVFLDKCIPPADSEGQALWVLDSFLVQGSHLWGSHAGCIIAVEETKANGCCGGENLAVLEFIPEPTIC